MTIAGRFWLVHCDRHWSRQVSTGRIGFVRGFGGQDIFTRLDAAHAHREVRAGCSVGVAAQVIRAGVKFNN